MDGYIIKYVTHWVQLKVRYQRRENPNQAKLTVILLRNPCPVGAQREWTSLEESGQSDPEETGQAGVFHHTLSWKGEVEGGVSNPQLAWLRAGLCGCSLLVTGAWREAAALPASPALNGGFWEQRQGWGSAC